MSDNVHVTAVPQDGHHVIECNKCGPLTSMRSVDHDVEKFCAQHLQAHGVTIPEEYQGYLDA